jgi:hypothetical protein
MILKRLQWLPEELEIEQSTALLVPCLLLENAVLHW